MRISLKDLSEEQRAAIEHLVEQGIVREKIGDFETTGLKRPAWPTQFAGLYRNLISGEIEPQGDEQFYIMPPDYAPLEPGAAMVTGLTRKTLQDSNALDWRYAAWRLYRWHQQALKTGDGSDRFEIEMADGSILEIPTEAVEDSELPISKALYTGHNLQSFDRRVDNQLLHRAMFPDWYAGSSGRSLPNDTLITARAAKLAQPGSIETGRNADTGRPSFRNGDLAQVNGWTLDGRLPDEMDLHNARDDILVTGANSVGLRSAATDTIRAMDRNTGKYAVRDALMHGDDGNTSAPVHLYGFMDRQGRLSGRMVTLAGLHNEYHDSSQATVVNLNALDQQALGEIDACRRADGAVDLARLTRLLDGYEAKGEPLIFGVSYNKQPIILPAELGMPDHARDAVTGRDLSREALENRARYLEDNPDIGAALVAARELAGLPRLWAQFPDIADPDGKAGRKVAAERLPEDAMLKGLKKKLWLTMGDEGEKQTRAFDVDDRHDNALFKYFAPQDFEYEHLDDPDAAFDPEKPDRVLGYLLHTDMRKHKLFGDNPPEELIDDITAIRANPAEAGAEDAAGEAPEAEKAGREDYIETFWRVRAALIDDFRDPLLRRQAILTVGDYRPSLLSTDQAAEYDAYHAWRLNDPAAPSERPSVPQMLRVIETIRKGPQSDPKLFADEALPDGRNPARDNLDRLHKEYKKDKSGAEKILKQLEKEYRAAAKAYPLTAQAKKILGLSGAAPKKPPRGPSAKRGMVAEGAIPG